MVVYGECKMAIVYVGYISHLFFDTGKTRGGASILTALENGRTWGLKNIQFFLFSFEMKEKAIGHKLAC